MSISNPNKLVEEFKKSGEFERIRRELFAQFQSSEGLAAFKSRVEDAARQRLSNDHNLMYMPQEFIHRELMQELDRFPIVERATSELPMFNDPAFSTRITGALEKILQDQGIAIKTKQVEQEQGLPQIPNPNSQEMGGSEGNKESHTAASDDENKESKTSDGFGVTPDVSTPPIKEAASAQKSPGPPKEGEDVSDKMEMDEDE